MDATSTRSSRPRSTPGPYAEKHYRELHRKHLIRLLITYLAPLVILTVYFQVQYHTLQNENLAFHMESIAESHAKTLDLFLRERQSNLSNIIDDPRVQIPPTPEMMQRHLEKLKRDSDTFIDIGYFDDSGIQAAYAGPLPMLEKRNYSREEWYVSLKNREDRYIITDIYLGFRQQPHFTIGVSRSIDGKYIVFRATLDPRKIYEYITSLEGSKDVYISIVNREGYYQVVTPNVGTVLDLSPFSPPDTPWLGTDNARVDPRTVMYAYAWLQTADWAVIVQETGAAARSTFLGMRTNIIVFSLVLILVIFSIILFRAKKLVQIEQEKEIAESQLEHAAKLASVGELAAGIAHEINNPLGIIASETGLMRDLMNPEFQLDTTFDDLQPHLENIREAAFRCRDITGKLLTFVRKNDMLLKRTDAHKLIDEIVDGFLEREMATSNITITKRYCSAPPEIIADANQLRQVLLNIINNAIDAITPPGTIEISTFCSDRSISIAVTDTGKGMTREQMNKVFLPFFTTKEVGKGTGLGLSVSYGIIKHLGGTITVDSAPGKGSTFTITLPAAGRPPDSEHSTGESNENTRR